MINPNLLWRCRRGIREMDLLLEHFVRDHYDRLTNDQKAIFAELLEQPDLDIMEWITGRMAPPSAEMEQLIAQIREVHQAP